MSGAYRNQGRLRTPGWEGGIAPLKLSSKDQIEVTCERREENGFVPHFLAAKEQTCTLRAFPHRDVAVTSVCWPCPTSILVMQRILCCFFFPDFFFFFLGTCKNINSAFHPLIKCFRIWAKRQRNAQMSFRKKRRHANLTAAAFCRMKPGAKRHVLFIVRYQNTSIKKNKKLIRLQHWQKLIFFFLIKDGNKIQKSEEKKHTMDLLKIRFMTILYVLGKKSHASY